MTIIELHCYKYLFLLFVLQTLFVLQVKVLSLGNDAHCHRTAKQFLSHGYNFINKRNKTQNIFYRNEVQYRDDVPTKRKVGM